MRLLLVFAVVVAAAAAQINQRRPGQTNNRVHNNQRPHNQQPQNQQQPPQKADSQKGTLLSLPEPQLCASRPKQWNFNGHNYFFSWDNEGEGFYELAGETQGRKVNWLEARNECRRRCMDAVSMETEAENNMIFQFIQDRNLSYIWTSGRLCDFTGCSERKDLHPINIYGWFWSNTNTKMAPTNSTPPGWAAQPWSPAGHTGGPQPDNAEYDINQTSESCLGVLNNIYKDGIKWHDIACYHKKPFVCEDSDALLDYVKGTNPTIIL
ncbi:uncharacterized protein LOC121853950 isoform X2 [Homarus americanus]|uniref:Putative C-type lectin-like 5 n=2 Tax=Homarus americanus TaxID=6706 RepID=A0A8J5TNQ4_HOMAM|nr:uncharacterized protein LOC121853950 isoform X2 [Homarus americanus]KAG7176072.1 putative C-type lectin-like 5 [Homarus americanus]